MTPESPTSSEVKELPQAAREVSTVLSVSQEPETLTPPEPARVSLSTLAAKLPLQLDLLVPLPSFRVQNLLSLEKGQVIESAWPHTEDLPLWSGGVHLVWTEFEVVDQKLAVRVTRLV
jgi:hypothetical protein